MEDKKVKEELISEKELQIASIIEKENKDILDAVLVFNMDNFNKVNEILGKEEGGHILDIVFDEINRIFRGTDQVLKLKGDEFLIFNKNIGDVNNAEILAENVLRTVSNLEVLENVKLSASVGIAIFPIHGDNYETLKSKAYQAMYRAKNSGKNQFRLYDNARTKALYHEAINDRNALYDILSKNEYSMELLDTNLSEIAIQILYEDRDIISALNSIIELLCIYLGFSKSYILSTRQTEIYDINKVSYCITGFESGVQSDIITKIRKDLICRINEEYRDICLIHDSDDGLEVNIFDYMDSQKAKDILFVPILKGEEFFGAVVFENHTDTIIDFPADTLQMFKREMNVIQSYVSNINSKRKNKEYIAKLEMLDNMDAYVYVVDTNTYDITFVNRKGLKCNTLPQIGEKCYKVLRNQDSPCEDCPFSNMNKDDSHSSACRESYNYCARKWTKNLYSWLNTRENNGKSIIISVDINDYFEE